MAYYGVITHVTCLHPFCVGDKRGHWKLVRLFSCFGSHCSTVHVLTALFNHWKKYAPIYEILHRLKYNNESSVGLV